MQENSTSEITRRKVKGKSEDNGEVSSTVLPPVPALGRITEAMKEQIQGHYIASIIYKDLEENLEQREKLAQEVEAKIHNIKAQVKLLVANKEKLEPQIQEMAAKQQQLKEDYQASAKELEEELTDIDRQIAELQKRKGEVEEQQRIQFKEQQAGHAQLQSSIDQLERQMTSLSDQQQELEEQIRLMPMPAELSSLDGRIADLIHHICSIFQPSVEHPNAELATKETSPGMVVPPLFQLDPWAAEENKGLTQVTVPMGAKQLILALNLPGEESLERYSAELYASNGRRVWNNDKLEAHGRTVSITFNTTFFLSDDYELRLKGRNSSHKYTPIAEYYFHIIKN